MDQSAEAAKERVFFDDGESHFFVIAIQMQFCSLFCIRTLQQMTELCRRLGLRIESIHSIPKNTLFRRLQLLQEMVGNFTSRPLD